MLLLTSSLLHFSDVDYFPVSDTIRVRIVTVVWKLCAVSVFVVRFKYVKKEATASNRLCGLKIEQLI